MAFYGYEPANYVPDYSGFATAASQIGTAIGTLAQRGLDKRMANDVYSEGEKRAIDQLKEVGITDPNEARTLYHRYYLPLNRGEDPAEALKRWAAKDADFQKFIESKQQAMKSASLGGEIAKEIQGYTVPEGVPGKPVPSYASEQTVPQQLGQTSVVGAPAAQMMEEGQPATPPSLGGFTEQNITQRGGRVVEPAQTQEEVYSRMPTEQAKDVASYSGFQGLPKEKTQAQLIQEQAEQRREAELQLKTQKANQAAIEFEKNFAQREKLGNIKAIQGNIKLKNDYLRIFNPYELDLNASLIETELLAATTKEIKVAQDKLALVAANERPYNKLVELEKLKIKEKKYIKMIADMSKMSAEAQSVQASLVPQLGGKGQKPQATPQSSNAPADPLGIFQ